MGTARSHPVDEEGWHEHWARLVVEHRIKESQDDATAAGEERFIQRPNHVYLEQESRRAFAAIEAGCGPWEALQLGMSLGTLIKEDQLEWHAIRGAVSLAAARAGGRAKSDAKVLAPESQALVRLAWLKAKKRLPGRKLEAIDQEIGTRLGKSGRTVRLWRSRWKADALD